MKFKKLMAVALASAMVFSMTACGGSSDSGKDADTGKKEESKGSDSKDVELSVSIWDANQEPGIKEILADFTEKT